MADAYKFQRLFNFWISEGILIAICVLSKQRSVVNYNIVQKYQERFLFNCTQHKRQRQDSYEDTNKQACKKNGQA